VTGQHRQHCDPKQALCGIQVQVQPWQNERDDTSFNNLRTECCDVEDPAAICTPTDNLKFLIRCDNTQGSAPISCVYNYNFGISYDVIDSVSETYESLGFDLANAGHALKTSYGNYGVSPVTGYNWTQAPAGTWLLETAGQGTVQVGPGHASEIYQIFGNCGIYGAATNSFKEVSSNKNIPFTRTFKL